MAEYILTEEDAITVARALNHFNNYLVGEYQKITGKEEVSDLIKEAARAQYNELTRAGTELHIKLAETFPKLRQP
jgi:hypothetical protein